MKKQKRHEFIMNIVSNYEVKTQSDLVNKLLEIGVKVTQATISRDIKELNLMKMPGKKYEVNINKQNQKKDEKEHIFEIIKENLVSIKGVGFMSVIRTFPGCAQSIAYNIDSGNFEEVLGTVAGDDTILIIFPNSQIRKLVQEKFQVFLEGK